MSEIRTTTTVELTSQPRREPFTCLAELLVGGSTLAVQASQTVSRSIAQNARLARGHSLTFPELNMIVSEAPTAQETLLQMSQRGHVAFPAAEAPAVSARLEGMVARNDKSGVEREISSAISARQNRDFAALVPMVLAACKAVGYQPERIDAKRGFIDVRGQGTEYGRIEVAKLKTGEVKLHFDTDGFEKDECTTKLVEPVIQHMRAAGAEFATQHQQPKRRNVYDQRRMRLPATCRVKR